MIEASHAADSFSSNLEICYEVLLYLSSRLAKLAPGQSLEFITSDPSAAEKIPDWCEQRGYMLLESHATADGDGRQRYVIAKPTQPAEAW